jgi:putative flippase GtrA
LSGFATNTLSFMALVYVFQWAVWPALIVAMLLAAAQTFVLSRWWAFRR